MSDPQHTDQPLQELATAAQLDEELDQQQQQQQLLRQHIQEQHPLDDATIIAPTDAAETANVATSITVAANAAFAHVKAEAAATAPTSSLGDVNAVIAAAARAHQAEQEQQQRQQQSPTDEASGTAMELDPSRPQAPSVASHVVDTNGNAAQPVTEAAAQTQVDPAVDETEVHEVDDRLRQLQDPDASMLSESGSPSKDSADISMSVTGTPKPKKERARPKPRSKSATKITRFRKITSCLQCREKKQKCDRQKPVCTNCKENPTDDPCHYVDDRKRPGSDDEFAGDSSIGSPLVKKRKQSDDTFWEASNQPILKNADFPRVYNRKQALVVQTRREMVVKLADVGKDKAKDFNLRVNAARAAAIADVLFESAITLPTADQVSALLYTYKTQVEPFVNVVVIDINVARIQSFLRWWHSKPTTMPADPPLVPLLLVILALSLQAKRSSPEFENQGLKDDSPLPGIQCSDERTLLTIAGHAIDALQLACPSAWSSAFQAPIDLTKASLLRGIWHLNELNLQFAGTCFALTTRLAHAAGLHRDPEHWSGMRIEEAQARRNLWWNIVFFEVAHAHRLGQPPCLSHEGFDTRYPDDYDALWAMYERAGLADPDLNKIILPTGTSALVPRTPTHHNFDYHWSRFRIYHIFLRQSQQLFRFGITSPPDPNLNDEYSKWREQLPEKFKSHFDRRTHGSVRPSEELLDQIRNQKFENKIFDPKLTEELQHYQQGYNLEFMYHQCMVTLHRPYIDEQGAWKPPESVQKSLEVCLHSAEALINTVEDVLATLPSSVMYNLCAYFGFNACLILAIHCKLDPTSQKHRPHIQKALHLLDTLSSTAPLKNVAEQAGRYSSTLKQMLNGIGGDIASMAASKTTLTGGAETEAGNSKPDAEASREVSVLNALDPSLGSDEARPAAEQRAGLDSGPDRIPAFLLPFVGLPADPNSLGPQPGNAFWTESLLDRPIESVPLAYPIGYGEASSAEAENGSGWAQSAEAAQEGDHRAQPEAGQAGQAGQAEVGAAATEGLNLYELLGGKAPSVDSNLPDRPMSFSQHYNHQNPSRDQASSASYRTYVQHSLARTHDQHARADDALKPDTGDNATVENGLDQPGLAGAKDADPQAHGNNLAGMWYAWENFSQILNNRQ